MSFRFPLVLSFILPALALAGCVPEKSKGHEAKNVAAQQTAMERATAAVPVPPTNNFVARQQLAEYMSRMDDPSKVGVGYLLGDNGNILGSHIEQENRRSAVREKG